MDGTRKECTIMFSSSQREGINHIFFHNPPSKVPEGKGRTCHRSKIGLFWSSAWLFPWSLQEIWMHPLTIPEDSRGNWGWLFPGWIYGQTWFLRPSPSSTFPFPFGHCHIHSSERKEHFKVFCNCFWHPPCKAPGSTPFGKRQRWMQANGHLQDRWQGVWSHLPKMGWFLS